MSSFAGVMRLIWQTMTYDELVQLRQRLTDAYHNELSNQQKADVDMAYLAECAKAALEVLVSVDAVLTMKAEELLQWHPSALSFAKR